MPTKVEESGDSCMSTQDTLRLLGRLELAHPSLSHPGRLMRLFSPIIRILRSVVNDIWHQFAMGKAIAAQLIGYYLPGFFTIAPQHPLEKPLCCSTIAFGL